MKNAWLINYAEEPMPDVALSREVAYKLAKDYLENMWLEDEIEYYRTIALRELETDYKESYDSDFGVIGYLTVTRINLYE